MLDQAIRENAIEIPDKTEFEEIQKNLDALSESSFEIFSEILKDHVRPKTSGRTKKNWNPLNTIKNSLDKNIQGIDRIKELSAKFKSIELDASVKRKVIRPKLWDESNSRYNQRVEAYKSGTAVDPIETLNIPLVFSVRLPAKPTYSITVKKKVKGVWGVSNFKISTSVPRPTSEAISLMNKHKDDFDYMECWWVPKDLKVEEITPPPADPVLVGVLKSFGKKYCFELTRWIDETVEDGWWSKEGY